MRRKVILISIDGMRPDGFLQCGNPYVDELMKKASYTLEGQSVCPSVTLPCHMSIFHSVTPERHGITTNVYTPMVRPISGLFEQVKNAGGVSAMFYGWEPIRDVSSPGALQYAQYIWSYSQENTDRILTDAALTHIKQCKPDFVFLYMVETDEKGGHDNGWMSAPYLQCLGSALENVKQVVSEVGDEYTVIVTADHGGHDRIHGTELPEDMTIPMLFVGPDFEEGKQLKNITLLDIAPTITQIMGIGSPREWEGKPIVSV